MLRSMESDLNAMYLDVRPAKAVCTTPARSWGGAAAAGLEASPRASQ